MLENEIGLLNIHDDSSEDDDRLMAPRTKNKSKKYDQVESEQVRVG